MSARDDFDERTKDILRRRVGGICSNPKCRKPTSGPQLDPNRAVNVGVAAHITSAAIGGPRYDAAFSSDERKAPENGIWLCQTCAKLIDNDAQRYTVGVLRQWKTLAEDWALQQIEGIATQLSFRDPLEELKDLLDEPDNWVKVQGDRYIRHRFKEQFVIKEGKTINQDFAERWTEHFPDQSAWSYEVEYWLGSVLLRTSVFVVTDGGRFTIPLPKRSKGPNQAEFYVDTNSLEWKTALLFEQYEDLYTTLRLVGVDCEKLELPGLTRAWPAPEAPR